MGPPPSCTSCPPGRSPLFRRRRSWSASRRPYCSFPTVPAACPLRTAPPPPPGPAHHTWSASTPCHSIHPSGRGWKRPRIHYDASGLVGKFWDCSPIVRGPGAIKLAQIVIEIHHRQ
jgi:hypothetical protein